MSSENIPVWVENRILAFFNTVKSVEDITGGAIKDDPSDGPGNTIGATLAARILRHRGQLPRRRFTDIDQLDSIRGVGKGTFKDFVYSLGAPAATAFRDFMYDNYIIYENWALEGFRIPFGELKEFNSIVQDEKRFRAWVAEQITTICKEKDISDEWCDQMTASVSSAYIDDYHNSTPAAAYALALWFYEFDADNWFSWERIQQACDYYFNYHMSSFPWEMELRFFKGFEQKGIINSGITPPDLPVVINWPERCVTLWVSALYD